MISETGEQLGVMTHHEAMTMARAAGLDLVEVVSTSVPPVCKIIDYGKFRYDQTKRERESRKSQHQIKVKEVKISPNISEHDLLIKLRQSREFLEKGNKVKITCQFRGREITHPELGEKLTRRVVQEMEDVSMIETVPKFLGKFLSLVLAPSGKKKKSSAP